MYSFPDLVSARVALLGESCEIANSVGLEYAVCGGWSPFLRNAQSTRHPGTKDVDLLFADGVKVDGLRQVFGAFRDRDFLPSAKHEFQLVRVYDVGGSRLAFNVDLLHPTEGKVRRDLFVDHVDLPVLEDQNAIARLKGKSIAAPYSSFVFTGFVDDEAVSYLRPDGTSATVRVPLIDEVGVLVTKSESCLNPKRARDLFDIYLALSQPRDHGRFVKRLEKLKACHSAAFNLLAGIRKAYHRTEGMSDANRSVFVVAGVRPETAQTAIEKFLQEWGLTGSEFEGPKE